MITVLLNCLCKTSRLCRASSVFALVSTLFLGSFPASSDVSPGDLYGVWTLSRDSGDHDASRKSIRQSCAEFIIIVHADMRLESLAFTDKGEVLLWSVSDQPCALLGGTLSCTVTTRMRNRVVTKSRPVQWLLEPVDEHTFHRVALGSPGQSQTIHRCPAQLEQVSPLTRMMARS